MSPEDLPIWRRIQSEGGELPWEGIRMLDEGEQPEALDMDYLNEADRANDDIMANVAAIEETAALITWAAENEDAEAYGFWRGPNDVALAQAPVVNLTNEGVFYLLPGRSLSEALCVEFDEWSDGFEALAGLCAEAGVEIAASGVDEVPEPTASPTPTEWHHRLYEAKLAT